MHSDPEGARVVADAVTGVTPFRLRYELPSKGGGATHPITVTWASGVTMTSDVNLCPSVGKEQSVVFARPVVADDSSMQKASGMDAQHWSWKKRWPTKKSSADSP